MRNFRDLEVWKNGIELVEEIYTVLDTFPSSERFALSAQISRSVVSIPSNIAEGCSRESQKDFSRFLQISLGSSYELETQLIIAEKVGYIAEEKLQNTLKKLGELQRSIHALKKYADSKTNNPKPNAL